MIKSCPVCLKQFEGRADKITCGDRCKKRMARKPKKADHMRENLITARSCMVGLTLYLDDPTFAKQAKNSLKSLIKEFAGYLPTEDLKELSKEFRELT